MKKLFSILFGMICLTSMVFAQEDIPTYNGKISKVKVFLGQAKLDKTATFPLKQGNNEVILLGNSPYMDPQSLQFTSMNEFIITDFTPFVQYVQPSQQVEDKLSTENKRQLKILRDSLEVLNSKNSDSYSLISILNKEKNVLENMKVISQPQTIDSMPKIKDGLSYYRDKMLEITKMLQKENTIITKRTKAINEINNQINLILQGELNNSNPRNEYYIRLNIYSEKSIPQCKLSYSYNVTGVSWQPYYDIKFSKPSEPVAFVLKARLIQQTGEDWKDITLMFSTEQPNNYRTLGELYPYYLIDNKPINYKANEKRLAKQNVASEDMMASDVENSLASVESSNVPLAKMANGTGYSDMTVSQLTMLGKEYEVGMKHTILSDGKEKTIALETKTTKADYKYYSIPKIDKTVYISALLPSWANLELMDATGKIYLEDSYINDTYVNSNSTSDTLNMSIGADKRVAIDRKVTKSKPEKVGLLSSLSETLVTVTISVKNNNQTKIDLNLVDQIPLSNTENITITPGDLAKAEYDSKTGKLIWNLSLNSLESKTITFTYTVRHPKNANLFLN